MDKRVDAEEHLRVIRSLMERATIYRAISAPTAIVGAALSMITASVVIWAGNNPIGASSLSLVNPGAARRFIVIWVIVLCATLIANTLFIAAKARREGSAFFTSGLRLAIYSTLPVLLVAAALTFLFWRGDETAEALPGLVITWMICYGLALLATANFAPGSLRILGWAFLLTGIASIFLTGPLLNAEPARNALIAMGLTFGLYHLVYALWTWPRKTDA